MSAANFTDEGRFTSSSTREYPEWFLTAFAVAEPEIFALASTGNKMILFFQGNTLLFSEIR